MDEPEQLSRLIGVIYDAALDAALWPHVLEGARAFIDGRAASIFWQDATSDRGQPITTPASMQAT
jgi:hypothetical protein